MTTKRKMAQRPRSLGITGEEFDALPADRKQKIFDEIDRTTPEQRRAKSRPLSAAERAYWNQYVRHDRKRQGSAGRPKLGPRGRGVKVISLSVERDLLDKADAFAKSLGMKRAEFFSSAIASAMAQT